MEFQTEFIFLSTNFVPVFSPLICKNIKIDFIEISKNRFIIFTNLVISRKLWTLQKGDKMKLHQTTKKIENLEFIPGLFISDTNCLSVVLFHILKGRKKTSDNFKKYLNTIKKAGSISENGNLIWHPVETLFQFSHRKLNSDEKIQWNKNLSYLVQVPYKNTGHFCEILDVKDNLIWYFDTCDNKIKNIQRERCISIRELKFEESKGETIAKKEEEKRITDAKPLSKWAMVLSNGIFYLETGIYCLTKKDLPPMHTLVSMLAVAIVPVITFSPVYFQLFMDKLVKIHESKRNVS